MHQRHRADYEIVTKTVTEICDAYDNRGAFRVRIPRFQRMLVWNQRKKLELLTSIKSGFPIGTFLMYRTSSQTPNIEENLLIDGLQRSNTLASFRRAPMSFLSEGDVDACLPPYQDILDSLVPEADSFDGAALKEAIFAWLSDKHSFLQSDGWSADELLDFVCEYLDASAPPNKALHRPLSLFLERIVAQTEIGDFKVPVIVYTGPSSNLADIFDRLNSEGVKLNKFQIFAASWNDKPVTISDQYIADAIKDTYRQFSTRAGVQIEVDPERLGTLEYRFSLFEYFLGLNFRLKTRFPHLFGQASTGESNADSASFNLVAATLNIPFSKMEDLLPRLVPEDPDSLTKHIFAACKHVSDALSPIVTLRGNSKRVRNTHAEYQIITYIALVYQERWDGDGKEKPGWKARWEKLAKTIPLHYLYDIITGAWSGHGDKRLLALLGPQRETLFQPISRSDWEHSLNRWFAAQLRAKEGKVTRIDPISILFLKYLYAHVQSHYDALAYTYDGEHLIPKNRLKNLIKRRSIAEGLPISNVGNISFLKVKSNRGKRDRTLYENIKSQSQYKDAPPEEQQRLRKATAAEALLPVLRDLRFDASNDDSGLTPDWFREFSESRFKYLTSRFLKLYAPRSTARNTAK